jgi:hypothetical protein
MTNIITYGCDYPHYHCTVEGSQHFPCRSWSHGSQGHVSLLILGHARKITRLREGEHRKNSSRKKLEKLPSKLSFLVNILGSGVDI